MRVDRIVSARKLPSLPREGRRERGSALFLLLILAVVMATILAGIFTYISTVANNEKRSNVRLDSTYVAEYAFEQAYQQLNTLVNQSSSALPDIAKTTTASNLGTVTSAFGASDGITWQAFLTVPINAGVPIATQPNYNPTQGVYKFLTVVEFSRQVPPMKNPVHMQFQREWNYAITPLFQYAIFYNSDMELFPGAAFNVGGRVHSNGRIYTGTTASITFTDFVTEVNGVSNGYNKPLDPRTQGALDGPVTYRKSPPVVSSRQNPPGQMNSDTGDLNLNNDGPHELIEIPNSLQTDSNAAERMYNKAGLKVLVNSTNADVTSSSGVAISANSKVFLTSDGTVISATDPLGTYLAGLVSSGTFQDYREGSSFTTADLDVGKVNTAYASGGLPQKIPTAARWPNDSSVPAALKNQPIPGGLQGKSFWNGVMYVTDVTNTSVHRAGVKLVNGTNLPDGTNASSPTAGLTVVSGNAAFIVGDYNTGGAPPVDSGTDLAADSFVSGYTRQPAAVVADAVTVVSSNWTTASYDSKSSLNQRPAANTAVNTALISGVVASDGMAYSGGVENYIRLLEDWAGKRLTYYGSMINVYQSQQSTGHWQATGNYYNAPARNWYFDTNFLNPNKLPPGTPVLRSLMRGQWAQIE